MKPLPILALHEISLYNTGRVAPEKIIAAFAARMQQFERIVADLAAEKPKSRAQHHLIVGQRGMGKTMLLARIAAELRTKAALSERFIPLVFAEEQYAVDRLSKFWLNCLDSLADAREALKDTASVVEIDATVGKLQSAGLRAVKDDQPFADEVYAAFIKAAHATGQRPVLLVDNLQLVFERLGNGQQHSLRELLMRPGSPILVGASPTPPPQSQDYGAAFYDQFKVHYLRPLEETEMRDLLLHLAEAAQRDDVRQRVLQHPARLKVLRQLTGGNPRTTLTLFFLYAEDFAPTVFGDLEGLLDRVTPLYKARFEELTPQQQVITSAIANHWDPVTAAKLAINTGLPAGTIGAQLDRLEKTGIIERTELFGDTRIGYMLSERFFNIWFLMRSASRRQRREVEFLTRFLESFYEPTDRSRIARHLMCEEHFSTDRYMWSQAVAASLTEPETAEELKRHNELTALREEAREARARLHELIDFDSLPKATLDFDDLRKRLISLVPESADIDPREFAKTVLGDRAMFMSGEREQLAARGTLTVEEIKSVMETCKKACATDVQSYSSEAVNWFSDRLARGQIRSVRDTEDWNRAFRQSPSECWLLMVDSLPIDFGSNLREENIVSIISLFQPELTAESSVWLVWGGRYIRLSCYAQAETALRMAIKRNPEDIATITAKQLANSAALATLTESNKAASEHSSVTQCNHSPDSNRTKALRRRIESLLSTKEAAAEALDATTSSLFGLRTHQTQILNQLIDAFAKIPKLSWTTLGWLLHNKLARYADAETAYRQAIALDPNVTLTWTCLAHLLRDHFQRCADAESAYREAIGCSPNSADSWNSLGNLYCDFMNRPDDAASAFDIAIQIDPTNESAHQNRLFLRRDFVGEGSTSRPLMDELRTLPTNQFPDTTLLHESLFAAYDSNWGIASEFMSKAIEIRKQGFSEDNTDDWLRASAVFLHLNYGAELLTFLDELGDTTARLRPWVEALRALHIGDRRALQNIAPEIRTTAEVFYDGIERRLKMLPEKTSRRPKPKSKRKGDSK